MHEAKIQNTSQAGFTLIEVVLSVGILASISFYTITSIKNQMDTRNRLEVVNGAQHALHRAMSKIYDDLRHAYIIPKEDKITFAKASLGFEPALLARSSSKEWAFTTQSFRSFTANTPQSNVSVIGYTVRPDPENSGRNQLIRRTDTDMRESLERGGMEQVLVNDLENFTIEFFDGQDFATQDWDTTGETNKGLLPKMARIKISAFIPQTESEQQMSELRSASDGNTQTNRNTLALETIVYLSNTVGQEETKEPLKEYRWK